MELTHIASRSGRLSSFLRQEMEMSSGLMNRLKWKGLLFVNGEARHTDFAVQPGDVITAALDEKLPEYPAQDGPLTVLYEDEHLLAVDKPSGMLIHPSHSQFTDTLANFVAGYFQRTGQACAFHPLTRLDRDTFGVVLLGKNSHIHSLLQASDVQKTYHALVFGCPDADNGVIDAPIARRPLPSLLREVREDGKKAATAYLVLEKHPQYTKLALTPVTGRTHQLRVHCAHMDFPILGDPQYGSEASQAFSSGLGLTAQALCAAQLELCHPVTRVPLCIRSQMDV